MSHVLLPAFVLTWRLDTAAAVGSVIGPWNLAWGLRRWRWSWAESRSARWLRQAGFALAAVGAAFEAAAELPGWLAVGLWRFVSSVSGGRLIAANTTSPWLVAGNRRFMPRVPPLPA